MHSWAPLTTSSPETATTSHHISSQRSPASQHRNISIVPPPLASRSPASSPPAGLSPPSATSTTSVSKRGSLPMPPAPFQDIVWETGIHGGAVTGSIRVRRRRRRSGGGDEGGRGRGRRQGRRRLLSVRERGRMGVIRRMRQGGR